MLRILLAQGWYIGISHIHTWPSSRVLLLIPVCYSLGIYLLNLFLAFLTPKFDPSLEQELLDQDSEEGNSGGLPVKQDDEFRPFIRRCSIPFL
jgi:Rer1 family